MYKYTCVHTYTYHDSYMTCTHSYSLIHIHVQTAATVPHTCIHTYTHTYRPWQRFAPHFCRILVIRVFLLVRGWSCL